MENEYYFSRKNWDFKDEDYLHPNRRYNMLINVITFQNEGIWPYIIEAR